MEKKVEANAENDDIERFLKSETDKTKKELAEIQSELEKLTKSLSDYINVLEEEIKLAFDMGDEKLWLSLTNKKAIILQRLAEIAQILNK
ncbi:MAG: hypothetical protein OHK0040_07610 [bacterium]